MEQFHIDQDGTIAQRTVQNENVEDRGRAVFCLSLLFRIGQVARSHVY